MLGADGEFIFSGRFQGSSVSGKLRQKYRDPVVGLCDTKLVTFTAHR